MNSNDKDTMEKETTQTMCMDRRPIDRGWAWVVLAAVTSIMTLVVGNIRHFGIFFLEIQYLFSASSTAVSSILSVEYTTSCLTGFVAMNLLAKFISFRTLVLCGSILCSLTFILDSISKDVFLLPFMHILSGAGLAFLYGPSTVILSTYFNRYLGTANAIAACGVSVGQFIFPYLINYLIITYGVRGALLLDAGICLQCLVFGALLRPISCYDTTTRSKVINSTDVELNDRNTTAKGGKQTESMKLQSDDEGEISPFLTDSKDRNSCGNVNLQSVELSESFVLKGKDCAYSSEKSSCEIKESITENDAKTHSERLFDGLRRNLQKCLAAADLTLFQEKVFLCGYIGIILGNTVSAIPLTYFPAHAIDLGLSTEDGATFLTVAGVTNFAGRLLMVFLADRRSLNRGRMLGVTLIIHGIAACFISYYTKFLLFVIYCACNGLATGLYFSISITVMVDLIGSQRMSGAMGFIIFGNGILGTVAYSFCGYFRDVTGSYNLGFLLNGVGLLLSGTLVLLAAFLSYNKQSREEL